MGTRVGNGWLLSVSFTSGLLSLSLPVGKPISSPPNGICLTGEYIHLDRHWLAVKGGAGGWGKSLEVTCRRCLCAHPCPFPWPLLVRFQPIDSCSLQGAVRLDLCLESTIFLVVSLIFKCRHVSEWSEEFSKVQTAGPHDGTQWVCGGAPEAACETSTPRDALDHSEQHKREFCLFLGLNFLLLLYPRDVHTCSCSFFFAWKTAHPKIRSTSKVALTARPFVNFPLLCRITYFLLLLPKHFADTFIL